MPATGTPDKLNRLRYPSASPARRAGSEVCTARRRARSRARSAPAPVSPSTTMLALPDAGPPDSTTWSDLTVIGFDDPQGKSRRRNEPIGTPRPRKDNAVGWTLPLAQAGLLSGTSQVRVEVRPYPAVNSYDLAKLTAVLVSGSSSRSFVGWLSVVT